jgi:cob(I)alamin adenosyltransferase
LFTLFAKVTHSFVNKSIFDANTTNHNTGTNTLGFDPQICRHKVPGVLIDHRIILGRTKAATSRRGIFIQICQCNGFIVVSHELHYTHAIMSITTKTGDTGQTRLFSGEQISKNNPRTHAYGDIDELVSILGIVRATTHKDELQKRILWLQEQLFIVGAELATTSLKTAKLPQKINAEMVHIIDQNCASLEKQITMPTTFILPGGTPAAAYIDLARAVTRRCERHIVGLCDSGAIENPALLIWMNRLSDYLWLLARYEEGELTRPLPSMG